MKAITAILVLAAALLAAGCGKTEVPPVPVGEMNEYRDPGFGFTIKYPGHWIQIGEAGKAIFTQSQEMRMKFIDPSQGIEGGLVQVEVLPLEGRTVEDFIAEGTASITEQQAEVGQRSDLTVGGKPAVKVPYSIQATSKNKIFGYDIYVAGDTAVYKLTIEGFGDQYAAHAAVFDAMVASFVPPVVVAKQPDVWQPAPTSSVLNNNFFTMGYPDNMEFVDVKRGDKDYVVSLRADRQDVSIQVDVFGAVGLTVDKVWEQNKGRYRGQRGSGETTIDGLKAFWVDYSPMANISSRAYFAVKNDKVVRTTLNWFAPKREVYFPVLEGMVKSMKLK